MTSTLKIHSVPCLDWCTASQGALLQQTLNRIQPRFVGLRREKASAERRAADLATEVSCLLLACYSLGLSLALVGCNNSTPLSFS